MANTPKRLCFCLSLALSHLLQDEVRDGSIGVDNNGGDLVISDLLEQRRGIVGVIQHPDREGFLGDEELAD